MKSNSVMVGVVDLIGVVDLKEVVVLSPLLHEVEICWCPSALGSYYFSVLNFLPFLPTPSQGF